MSEWEGKTVAAMDWIDGTATLCLAFTDGSEYQLFGTIHHELKVKQTNPPAPSSDREERIEKAVEAARIAAWDDPALVRQIVEEAAPFLESSPAPDEVVVKPEWSEDKHYAHGYTAGYEAGIKAAREAVDRVLTEWFGDRRPSGSLPRDEWGPDCAGCGNEEYRIDGYCSIECRDNHEVIGELLASLDPKGNQE